MHIQFIIHTGLEYPLLTTKFLLMGLESKIRLVRGGTLRSANENTNGKAIGTMIISMIQIKVCFMSGSTAMAIL